MIWLLTDFSTQGPYAGQMRAVLARQAPAVPVVDLMHDVPAYRPEAGAHLLAACAGQALAGDVFLCVVDPGVGTSRRAVVVEADGRVYVGPDNGLFEVVSARARQARWWEITWRPEALSASFHGRDLFAPVAARLALGAALASLGRPIEAPGSASDDDLREIIYIDGFGNAMTGLRGAALHRQAVLGIAGRRLRYRRTFGEADPGEAFWYVNALDLVEVAANGDSAARLLGLAVGEPVVVSPG